MASIGFLSNQLDNRGTGNALYNYAHYNEEILGNKSLIYTFYRGNHNNEAEVRFEERFGKVNFVESQKDFRGFDALYHIKSGYNDGFDVSIPYLVHSVFDNDPHGTVYATISPWMGERFSLPFVPHIVEVSQTTRSFRDELELSEDDVVFGRYGGLDSFDIPWVWAGIEATLALYPNTYFIFMNTNKVLEHPRVKYMNATVDPILKKMFINTCDAMIHARSRGETFGIAVGEFAIAGKPIITYSESGEKAHLQELGNFALTYGNLKELCDRLQQVIQGPLVSWGYGQYTPDNVMKKFKEVFLDAINLPS